MMFDLFNKKKLARATKANQVLISEIWKLKKGNELLLSQIKLDSCVIQRQGETIHRLLVGEAIERELLEATTTSKTKRGRPRKAK